MKERIYRILLILSSIAVAFVVTFIVAIVIFINQPKFGKLPKGERLERIKQSPNYKDGAFHNLHKKPQIVSDKGFIENIFDFIFRKIEGVQPDSAIYAVKTNLWELNKNDDLFIWFGHSSYLIQTSGKRILVDPVFCQASPVSFANKPFQGSDIYKPEDIPEIDYLFITHDHWDHLDYETVIKIKERVGKVVCPLGVGSHLEHWGFDPNMIVELDWNEKATLDNGFKIECLPAHHFSGRGLSRNGTLWASFMIETPSQNIYIGGDGGYDTQFAEIANRYPNIDIAMLENGQYNKDWRYIHLMPDDLIKATKDLNAKLTFAIHNSKYALAKHHWNEPQRNVERAIKEEHLNIKAPIIGEVVNL